MKKTQFIIALLISSVSFAQMGIGPGISDNYWVYDGSSLKPIVSTVEIDSLELGGTTHGDWPSSDSTASVTAGEFLNLEGYGGNYFGRSGGFFSSTTVGIDPGKTDIAIVGDSVFAAVIGPGSNADYVILPDGSTVNLNLVPAGSGSNDNIQIAYFDDTLYVAHGHYPYLMLEKSADMGLTWSSQAYPYYQVKFTLSTSGNALFFGLVMSGTETRNELHVLGAGILVDTLAYSAGYIPGSQGEYVDGEWYQPITSGSLYHIAPSYVHGDGTSWAITQSSIITKYGSSVAGLVAHGDSVYIPQHRYGYSTYYIMRGHSSIHTEYLSGVNSTLFANGSMGRNVSIDGSLYWIDGTTLWKWLSPSVHESFDLSSYMDAGPYYLEDNSGQLNIYTTHSGNWVKIVASSDPGHNTGSPTGASLFFTNLKNGVGNMLFNSAANFYFTADSGHVDLGGADLDSVGTATVESLAGGYLIVSGAKTLTSGECLFVEQQANAEVKLPPSPATGAIFFITFTHADGGSISGNGKNINGSATISAVLDDSFMLVYNGTQWRSF